MSMVTIAQLRKFTKIIGTIEFFRCVNFTVCKLYIINL